MRIAAAVGQVLALACVAAHVHAADPMHSRECMAARAALEDATDAAVKKQPGSAERLASARKEAADACLGRDSPDRERAGAPDPPIAVAPPVMQPPHVPAQPAIVVQTPVAPAPPRPGAITTCDPGGCWDSNGQRLNTLGPMVVGPHGPCTIVAGQARCP